MNETWKLGNKKAKGSVELKKVKKTFKHLVFHWRKISYFNVICQQ